MVDNLDQVNLFNSDLRKLTGEKNCNCGIKRIHFWISVKEGFLLSKEKKSYVKIFLIKKTALFWGRGGCGFLLFFCNLVQGASKKRVMCLLVHKFIASHILCFLQCALVGLT